MAVPESLRRGLALPVIGAPLFIVSTPELVIAQCKAGVIGAFPALNARPPGELERWIERIEAELAACPGAAAYAVNQIVHRSNPRLEHDLEVCVRHRVPLVITSLRAPGEVVPAVHGYGGLVFHDVISVRHAEKALEAGVDGLILVCAGAGGHGGTLSPFALMAEVRRFYDGPIALSGAIATGRGILAALALGADFAYIGTRFIATREARASDAYKACLVDSTAADIVYTPYFSGVAGNYLRASIVAAGFDPEHLPSAESPPLDLAAATTAKVWKDIWGAGQGVGAIDDLPPTADLVARLAREYAAARVALNRLSP
ncbi:MAG: nitronate monooxygenase [Azonexus sp.]|nr:nitronate monooxygenase [Betaproteobacteria bacterium]MBK8918117.1 nitronate monooxygenase [Betaproteobacteria bacterium]MBP6035334.1 nitronate monooxygenase [Azonexus sp.]MBP6906091.1 nitronate monooxygenase [Azonexus sp.]